MISAVLDYNNEVYKDIDIKLYDNSGTVIIKDNLYDNNKQTLKEFIYNIEYKDYIYIIHDGGQTNYFHKEAYDLLSKHNLSTYVNLESNKFYLVLDNTYRKYFPEINELFVITYNRDKIKEYLLLLHRNIRDAINYFSMRDLLKIYY